MCLCSSAILELPVELDAENFSYNFSSLHTWPDGGSFYGFLLASLQVCFKIQ